jgi:hypothetical protein
MGIGRMGIGRARRGAAVVTATVLASGAFAGAVLGIGALTSPGYAAAPVPGSTLLFHYADPQIDESSGIAESSYGDGIIYTFNDSGDTARFFAVNSSGATAAIYTLQGATNHDWEDMDTGTDASGNPVLYFGDIGDNSSKRTEIDVYQVPEPRGPSADVPWVRYRFQYPDGSHNAETLMVDPHTHRIFIASKKGLGEGTGLLYEAPAVLSTTAINMLAIVEPPISIPNLTTSGDISPDGKLMVLLTYFSAYWAVGVNGALHAFPVTEQRQDEGIAFTRDGKSILVDSEGKGLAVYRIPLPAEALAADAAGGAPTPTPTPRPTAKPKPTVQPTVRPTAQPPGQPSGQPPAQPPVAPTARPTATASPGTQIPSPVTTSSPLPGFNSFELGPQPTSSAFVSASPGPSQGASSKGRASSTFASDSAGLVWLFVLLVVVGGVGILLGVAHRLHRWPWGRA